MKFKNLVFLSILVAASLSQATVINPGGSGGSSAPTTRNCVRTLGGQGSGANAGILYFTVLQDDLGGSDITYTSSSSNGDSWTINTSGMYSLQLVTYGGDGVGYSISRNATTKTNEGPGNTAYVQKLAFGNAGGANYGVTLNYVGHLDATDVIRFAGSAGSAPADAFSFACLQRVN